MAKVQTLSVEDEEARRPYVPVADTAIYVGDQVRVRELYATGLPIRMKVGKRTREVRAQLERVLVGKVTRVAVGKDGHVYVVADVIEGHPSTKAYRINHRVGSARMASKSPTKELLRHPDHGPSPAERLAEIPVDHSRRIRIARFRELVEAAVAGGVREELVWETLERTGETYAEDNFEKTGKSDRPTDLGDAEIAQVRAVRDLGREPEYWMLPVVQAAADDPDAFVAQHEWRDLA